MTLRRLLFVALLVALVPSTLQWMHEDDAVPDANALLDTAKELQAASGGSTLARAEALQRVLDEADRQRDALSAEQRALVEDLRSARGDVKRERALENLTGALEYGRHETRSFYGWAAGAWKAAWRAYGDVQPQAQWWLWTTAFVLVAATVAAAVCSRLAFARLFAAFGLRVSRGWLVVLSFVAIVLTIATRTNPWTAIPSELIMPPLLALVGSALALRVIDFNYPVWNSLVRGCGAPLISMALVATYLRLIQL